MVVVPVRISKRGRSSSRDRGAPKAAASGAARRRKENTNEWISQRCRRQQQHEAPAGQLLLHATHFAMMKAFPPCPPRRRS